MPHPIDVAIGNRIRSIRMMQNISQEQLGHKIGVSFQQVQKNEKGTNRISASRIVQISEALNVPVASLFDGLECTKSIKHHAPIDEETMKLMREWVNIKNPAMKKAVRDFVRAMVQASENA